MRIRRPRDHVVEQLDCVDDDDHDRREVDRDDGSSNDGGLGWHTAPQLRLIADGIPLRRGATVPLRDFGRRGRKRANDDVTDDGS